MCPPMSATRPVSTINFTRKVSLLGIAQIVSWGSLYYSLAVLAAPIRHTLGFSDFTIFSAFSAGMIVSGIAAPIVGRYIDAHGGRGTMTFGSLLAALALITVALAQEAIVFTLGWVIAGIAMTACLYDPAFATLSQILPDRYRRAITVLTLFGGLASTVFWPLSNALAEMWGWRGTLLFFAALHLVICVPIHLGVLPATTPQRTHAGASPALPDERGYLRDPRFYWLSASFAGATLVFSALSAFMIAALGTRGFTSDEAVWIAALIGPMQVTARVVEWMLGDRFPPLRVGIAACVLSLVAMILLNSMSHSIVLGALFATCYGATNGILTIVRGTVPAELFGPQRQGALLGALARPAFIARAVTPALFAAALSLGVPLRTGLLLLAAVSAIALVCFIFAGRKAS
jgi:predicted MFS family arabinose efflux permease